jgi:DNA-binding MarR family transcriptional regulator
MEKKQDQLNNPEVSQPAESIEAMVPQIRQTISAIKSVMGQYIGVSMVRVNLFEQMNALQEISQAEIQRKIGVGGAVITRILKQMEAERLITRRPDPADNRYTLVRLTVLGSQRKEDVIRKTRKIESTLLQGLDVEELKCLHLTLAHIRRNAESLIIKSSARDTTGDAPNKESSN